ncbi:DUF4065 domain-containing protein [Erysipelotrichaceae bacterium AF19-24AC]|nr:DUF4065 domain-containing protein [Erysipelotrichaceae bacterium AF19-24AC]
MNANYTIFQIAKWFLEKDSMTLKRLQKLCYYAQAWFYTLKRVKLADTEYEAWAHGPVSPALWGKLKGKYYDYGPMYDFNVSDLPNSVNITDPDDIELLEMVWNTYGDQSGTSLEALSHSEKPWKNARGNCSEGERCNSVISLESMRDYYSSIYEGDYGE